MVEDYSTNNYCWHLRIRVSALTNLEQRTTAYDKEERPSDMALYQQIYDPLTNERHAGAKWWSSEDKEGHGSYSLYEGYGRGDVKAAFMESVNEDNEVWSTDTPNRKPLTFAGAAKTMVCSGRWEGPGTGLNYEEGYHYQQIDFSDRDKKTSAVFSQMLCEYVEKAYTPDEKDMFFDYCGKGRKWSKDKELMDRLEERFLEVEEAYANSHFALSLCEQSIKRSRPYPKSHFMNLLAKFKEFRENGPRFSVGAKDFNPRKNVGTGLARTSVKKVAGVPMVACSKEHVSWDKVQDDFQTLCKKLDSVIALAGPVIRAENV